ncbi:hypothetical protein ABPG75_004855 [Micractinium tetrahymenae]
MGAGKGASPPLLRWDGPAGEEEPRLKYGPLGADSPRVAAVSATASRLAVSDKVLAVGHRDGAVHLLSHQGDQVRSFKEHSGEVTDLCFDDSAEYLASASSDGTVAVYGLYTEEVQRFNLGAPVTAVALDPRYAARKTREFVYGTAAGTLALCSKGWLGNKETALFQGKGLLRCARMSGTLLAWASDNGLRVYDTATHTRLGKLERPASAAADPAAPCSMLWRGERELFVSWGRQVWVLRLVGSLLPAAPGGQPGSAPGRSLQIVASFDAGCAALGAAPFGAELAVLTWGMPPGQGSSAGADGAAVGAPGSDGDGTAAGGAAAHGQVGMVLPAGATTSAEEQAADASAPAADTAATAAAAAAAALPAAAADANAATDAAATAAAAPQQGQQQQLVGPGSQQEQPLSLSFFTRAGSLLASDALGSSSTAADRRWHQLALLYPGDADLRLAAAAPAALPASPALAATPRRTPAGSTAGSRAGSVPSSGRSSPVRVLSGRRGGRSSFEKPADGGGGTAAAAGAAAAGAADGQLAPLDGQHTPPPALQQSALGSAEQHVSGSGGGSPSADGAAAVQQYKWWRDGEEPLYLVSAPEGITVGRPRDGNDRVAWLAERGRYAEALTVAEEDSSVQPASLEAVGEQCLQALVREGRYEEAAALASRVLKANELAWERWVYTFAQARQLAALAPRLPTADPRLKPSTYDMVLSSLLLHPAEHQVLLQAVKSWPQGIYDAPALQAAVLSRMGSSGSGAWPALQQVAAHLYTAQGRHEEALQLMLQLRSPAVFEYIARHAMVDRLAPYAAALVDLDEKRATSLLVENADEVPPPAVVAALQDSAARAAQGEHRLRWRRRLHRYLDGLFLKDSQAGAEFAELQVELYAEFEPSRLLNFLMVSPTYPLERAYQVCEARGLTREMVFVLGRMGSAEKALRLIVEGLRDVGQAVEFVQLQRDDDLWEQLIALTLGDAQLTGALLDHAGGYIDPLRVVSQIPQHMKVDNLRGRLVKIIADFRTQMCLQQGCNTILRHDCVVLANRLYRLLRSSLRRLHLCLHSQGGASKWVLYDCRTGAEMAEDDTPAALLGWQPAAAAPAAAGSGDGTPPQGRPAPSSSSSSPATGARSGQQASPQQAQQQAQQGAPPQRVWVGFVGGPPPPAGSGIEAERQQQQHPARSPGRPVRLGSTAPSPGAARSPALAPRKLLVT